MTISINIPVLLSVLVVLIVAVYVAVQLIRRVYFDPYGKRALRKTRRILGSFARRRKGRLLAQVEIQDRHGNRHIIEHLLAAPFGILLVKTFGAQGEYYGMPEDKGEWSHVQDNVRRRFPNALLEQKAQRALLLELFSANGIHNVPMDNVVWYSNRPKKTTLYLRDERILTSRGLKPYLKKEFFIKNNNVDADAIAALLSRDRQENP